MNNIAVAVAVFVTAFAGVAAPAAAGPKKKPRPLPAPVATPPPAPAPEEAKLPPPPPPEPVVVKQAKRDERKTLRLAVYELKAEGVDPRVARIVGEAVVAELRKLQHVSVVSMDEVRAMLDMEAQKQIVGCSDESCAAEIAEALGVDGIVIGNLAVIAGQRVFGLRRIDQREAKTLGQVSQRLDDAGGEEFLAAIGPAVAQLFAEFPLRAGVERGVPKAVGMRLNPPPLPPAVFWTVAGTTAAVGVTTAAVLGVNVATWRQNTVKLANATASNPADGRELKSEQDLIDQTFWASLALGSGVALGTGAATVVALFTDWNGYGNDAAAAAPQ